MVEPALVLGGVDFALCAAAGLAVLFSAPGRTANRVLALFLFFEGTLLLSAGMALLPGQPGDVRAGFSGVFAVSVGIVPMLTLAVVRELPTPIVAPLRSRGAGVALVTVALVLAAWNLSDPPYPRENPTTQTTYLILAATNIVSLVASLHAWLRSPRGSATRRQARLFFAAFGVRDLSVIVFFATASGKEHGLYVLGAPILFYGTLLLVPLLAYAIMRAQVLGIELVLKAGLRRALVVGAFVVVFFAVSESAERLLAARYGPAAGVLAAAVLAILVRPVDRFAERVADRVMPEVRRDDAYLRARRLELYRAAVESAHESGGISERERAALARLREKLGVPADAATRLEREVLLGAPA